MTHPPLSVSHKYAAADLNTFEVVYNTIKF